MPHIREAAREIVAKLQLEDPQQVRQQDLRLDKKQQDTFYVGVHVR